MWEAEWTAVLAGTPVDSRMGVRVLAEYGLEGRAFPMAEDPWRQTAFQLSTPAEKTAAVRSVLEGVREHGCRRVLVYCNSLSAAVEFELLAEETGLRIVTPLQVYRDLAPCFRRLGLIAANAQGLAGIERTLYGTNPSLELLGACLLPVVLAIESGEAPEALVERHRLPELAEWFRGCGMEALVLGCTHFPLLAGAIGEAAGPGVELVNSGAAGAMECASLLEGGGLLCGRDSGGTLRCLVSGDEAKFARDAKLFLPDEAAIRVEKA